MRYHSDVKKHSIRVNLEHRVGIRRTNRQEEINRGITLLAVDIPHDYHGGGTAEAELRQKSSMRLHLFFFQGIVFVGVITQQ